MGSFVSSPSAIRQEFVSAPQTITAAGALTIAHGLGVVPEFVTCFMTCLTAEAGYNVGDVVEYSYQTNNAPFGVSLIKNNTNLIIRFGASGIGGIWATTGANAIFTPANWSITFRAYA